MTRLLLYFSLLLTISWLSFSCNPDCTSYTVVDVTLEPEIRFPGEEVLVKTTPANFLENRQLYMAKSAAEGGGVAMMESTYHSEVGGRIAKVDEALTNVGDQQIYVQDNDCGGLIALQSVQVADQSFASLNPSLFVIPTPSIIIIPPPPIPAPSNIVNTWFSPDDPKYCIWFDPQVDTVYEANGIDFCTREKAVLRAGDIVAGTGTRELRCGGTDTDLDHDNPITGTINQTTGQVSYTVNREAKGLGTETFVGQLVEPTDLPPTHQLGGRCLADESHPVTMMVVKSQETGRTLVLYRQGPADFMDPSCD